MNIPHQLRSLLTILLLLLVPTSCHIPLDEAVGPYRTVENRPDHADLVGTWTIDQPTIKFMKSRGSFDGSRPTKLVLKHDGSFVLSRMPDWSPNGGIESLGALKDLEGRWNLYEINSCWTINLHDATNQWTPQLWLREPRYRSTPKYLLQIIIGDPDSRESMIFLRDR